MTPEQMMRNAAIVNANVARAMLRMEGMKADNQYRLNVGEAVAYREESFIEVIHEEGIDYNQILNQLNQEP